jgi:hypothetical protein
MEAIQHGIRLIFFSILADLVQRVLDADELFLDKVWNFGLVQPDARSFCNVRARTILALSDAFLRDQRASVDPQLLIISDNLRGKLLEASFIVLKQLLMITLAGTVAVKHLAKV